MVAATTTTNISNNYEKLSKMANMMDVTADSIKPEESFYDKTMDNNDLITEKPTLHIESEDKSVKSNDLDSFNSYDGTVHEVVPVSYIVESKNTTSGEGSKQGSPEKEVIVIEDDDEEENEKNTVNDKAPPHAESKDDVDNDDHEHRARQLNQKFGSFNFVKKTNSITLKNENGSFRLNVPAKSKHSATPSVASGQTASVSDYAINTPIMSEQSTFSYTQDNSKPRRRLNIDRQPTIKTIASNPSSIEPDFVVDSNHTYNTQDSKRKPDRMETIEIKPTIPARSRNRPSSTVYSGENHSKQNSLSSKFSNSSPSKYKRASLDFMQEQLGEQMEELKSIVSQQSDNEDEIQIKKEPENEHIDVSEFKAEINAQGQPNFGNSSPDKSSSRATPVTSNGFDEDDFYSAASDFADVESPIVSGNKQFVGNLNKRESVALDDSYLNRPIPNIPHNSNKKVVNDEDDDEYEDIEYVTKSPTKLDRSLSKMSRNSIRTGRSKVSGFTSLVKPGNDTNVGNNAASKGGNKQRKEIRSSFDIDTLAQLLSVTKGTMIGSEFANLGMKSEEKIALEKLVDSLSRLTSDMILDPERYEEGLKRLKKATRALEGF